MSPDDECRLQAAVLAFSRFCAVQRIGNVAIDGMAGRSASACSNGISVKYKQRFVLFLVMLHCSGTRAKKNC
jgi:hypothetical protein